MRRLSPSLCLLLLACTPAPATRPRYGEVMAELGQRFERSGRAAVAGRWELAAFEAGELKELCTGALARAELPQEGPTQALGALTEVFVRTGLPPLAAAAGARDPAAYAAAFEAAAVQCNACHAATAKAFIEVPLKAGAEVPVLTPLAEAPAQAPGAAPPPPRPSPR